jgi:predicted acyltransferase
MEKGISCQLCVYLTHLEKIPSRNIENESAYSGLQHTNFPNAFLYDLYFPYLHIVAALMSIMNTALIILMDGRGNKLNRRINFTFLHCYHTYLPL